MRKSGGGAATASGMDFQHRVAAWVATHILAEKDATPPWELPSVTTLEWISCETEEPVDDLLVGTSEKGLVIAQIKRSLDLSESEESPLASVLDQFVRQFVVSRDRIAGIRPWERPLDPTRDRLLLITSPSSSEPVRIHLAAVLRRFRSLLPNQLPDDAAVNQDEHRAFSTIRQHLSRSWKRSVGTGLPDHELRQLLSVVYVHVLDMDEGREGEREARTLLRTTILRNPNEAEKAWARIITLCADLAAKRSIANRLDLQRALVSADLKLNAPRGYRQDIERLKEYSAMTFDALAHLAEIRSGPIEVKLHRKSTEALTQAVEKGSILVVGEPGAGKSGALHDLVKACRERGLDFIFLAVDRLAAGSLAELRQEIGLEHELTQVLENWPGLISGLLVIDALDAARGDPATTMIRDLIRIVMAKCSRWHLVASIRKFDLRYGVEVKELFAGAPPTSYQDLEFGGVRHLNIPRLSEEELHQIGSQAPELKALINTAPIELRDLLLIPFNLRLIAELLGTGVATHELTPISTQLELLHRYWSHRVIRSDGGGDAREDLLRIASEKMVAERALRVNRSALSPLVSSERLRDLLSSHVLIEWNPSSIHPPDRYVVAFSHNVLFDYTVARLLLNGAPTAVINRLVNDPELAIVVRPSFLLHFRQLWAVDNTHRQFWDLVFRVIQTDQIPEVGKLIGPSVAAEHTRALSDVEPLCAALDDFSLENHTAAEQALRHLFGSLLAGAPGEVALAGPDAGPWCHLLERVSRNLSAPVAYTVRSLLSTICGHPEDFTPEQRVTVGHAARRLLDFAWTHPPRDKYLVIHALEGVCRTFESDPTEAAALIKRCLESAHLLQYGFEEMPWLAREAKRLIPLDPGLVEEIYRAAFTHHETSAEPTPMGGGRILTLISNRRQDYGMALYELAEVFPAFLQYAPENATRALIAAMESYVAQRHSTASGDEHEERFVFNGQQASLRTDYSAIWDEADTHRHDDALKMLDAFQKYMEELAKQTDGIEKLRNLVMLLIAENRLAVLWRRILSVAAQHPGSLGREILPLASANPILTCFDTTTSAGEFLKAIFPLLSSGERQQIELAILNIPGTFPSGRREAGEHVRNRLLGCLVDVQLVTEDAQSLLKQLKAQNAVPSNVPPARFESGSLPFGEEEFLKEQGVPVEAEANRKIRELGHPVKEFADKNLNSTPALEEVSNILPKLQKLYDALSRADIDGVHPKQGQHVWGCLTSACARIARTEGLSCETPAGAFVKDVLLEGSHCEEPTHDPKYDTQFDEHPSWGGPSPRIEAAEGLIVLGRHSTCSDSEVLSAIQRLSNDPVPAVRFQIARSLNTLYRTAPELMWCLIERISKEEQSRGVLQGLLSGPLQRIAGSNPERVAEIAKTVFDRVKDGPGAKTVREFCIGIFTGLYIWQGQALSQDLVLNIAANPGAFPEEAPHLLAHLRQPLTHGPTNPPDSGADAVRLRALDLLDRILCSARDGLREIEQRYRSAQLNNWSQEDQESAKSLGRLIDHVGSEIYFASGAYDNKRKGQGEKDQRLIREREERFYGEVRPILDKLADVGFPSVAHHLLETLEFFIALDPRGVFLGIGRVVRAGQQGGYQYESLAANLVVKLVERYLAEHRALLREDVECRQSLIEILDIFVQVGWPTARRLTYRLEEIFR